MTLKIPHLCQNRKKYLINLQIKPVKKIDSDKKVNSDDLIQRYRGNNADVKFNEFDNAFNIINKIQNGEIRLGDVKNNQEKF